MHLKLVCVRGYKRFAEKACMDTRGPLVAIVGPNEAGKTSFLRAAEHISHEAGIPREELTDRQPSRGDWIVSGHFSLEADERKLLKGVIPKGTEVTYIRYRYADGRGEWDVSPHIPRGLKLRERAARHLEKAYTQGWLPQTADDEDEADEPLATRAKNLAGELTSQADHLMDPVQHELRAVAKTIAHTVTDKSRKELAALARAVAMASDAEAQPTPHARIHEVLSSRVPRFLFFGAQQRRLVTDYPWDETTRAPPALENLFALAKLDFDEFRDAAMRDDRATWEALQEKANDELDEAFKAWRQADLHVSFSADQQSLQLLIRDRTTVSRTRLDERSAGLREFIALFAFTARYGEDVRPVLLVDEAETHLHYGGQADLIRVFERQRVAETIIYSTHSIGCLPNDLGATIRVISPSTESRSKVRNSFWASETDDAKVGLTPMMFAMGAEALAFTPSRRAVIGEGASEAILLPSLLRESLPPKQREEPLGYQVAPGISEVDPERSGHLEMEAGSVAYLVDGDSGGRNHRRKLPDRALKEKRVLTLGEADGASLEDFIDTRALAEGLNRLMSRRKVSADRLQHDELPLVGRGRFLVEWCASRGLDLSKHKAAFAQGVLDVGRERGHLIEDERKLV